MRWSCGSSSPRSSRSRPHEQAAVGIMHFAVTVDDVPEALARVEAAGGRARFPVKRSAATRRGAFVYCEDPDGHVFELLERSTIPRPSRIILAGNRRRGGGDVKVDVAVVGAGTAGLVAPRRARKAGEEGGPRRAGAHARRPLAPLAAPRPRDRARLAPRRGPGRQPDARLRAARRHARALRPQRLDAVLGPHRLEADPGVLRRRLPSRG